MQAAHVVPELALARVVTAGGPYEPGDEISLAYTTPGIVRLVAHDAGLRARCVSLERALIPEMISVAIIHPASRYRAGEIIKLSFVDPRIARVYSNEENVATDGASETRNVITDPIRPVAGMTNEVTQRRRTVAEPRSGSPEQNVVARPLERYVPQRAVAVLPEMRDFAAEPQHDVAMRENAARAQRIAVAALRGGESQPLSAGAEGQNAVTRPLIAKVEQHDADRERLDGGSTRCNEAAETASSVDRKLKPEAARLSAGIEQRAAAPFDALSDQLEGDERVISVTGERISRVKPVNAIPEHLEAEAIRSKEQAKALRAITEHLDAEALRSNKIMSDKQPAILADGMSETTDTPGLDASYAPVSEEATRQIRLGERMTMQAAIERPNDIEPQRAPRLAAKLDRVAPKDDRTLSADFERGTSSIEPLRARVSVRLEWNPERIRRFVQVVDKLFTMDRLGWYRHSLAMRLLIPDLVTCADTLASVEAMRHLRALRAAAVESLGNPLLAACMPGFVITSQWLQTLESPREARAIAGLREALFPYAGDDQESSGTLVAGALFTTGTVTRRELLPENATSVEAFLPLLIPAGSHDAVLNDRLTQYRRLLIDLFAQTARAGEQVRLHQMAQPNHSLDDRLWQVVGAAAEAFGGFAHA